MSSGDSEVVVVTRDIEVGDSPHTRDAGNSAAQFLGDSIIRAGDRDRHTGLNWSTTVMEVYGIFVHQLPCPSAFYVINRRRTPFKSIFCSRHSNPGRGGSILTKQMSRVSHTLSTTTCQVTLRTTCTESVEPVELVLPVLRSPSSLRVTRSWAETCARF